MQLLFTEVGSKVREKFPHKGQTSQYLHKPRSEQGLQSHLVGTARNPPTEERLTRVSCSLGGPLGLSASSGASFFFLLTVTSTSSLLAALLAL